MRIKLKKGEKPMDTGHGPEQEQNQEKYSFLQEVIKDEKSHPKKLLEKIVKLLTKGLIFGLAACVGFFALKPWASNNFVDSTSKVEIPQDEEHEITEEPTVSEPVECELTIENYKELSKALSQVVREAKRSVVLLTGIQQDESWGNNFDSDFAQTYGFIVADNGRELLILANYSSMKDAQLFQAKFSDGSEQEAAMKQKDGNTDLAVFSVAKSGIASESWDKIKVAELGNSGTLTQGATLIAVGSPFGYADGLGYGIASTVNQSVIRADGEYDILVTDMPGSKECSGILFDVNGKVMGIIDKKLTNTSDAETLTALGISAVKNEIELMSNGKNVPYIGVIGAVITKEISEARGIPAGLYVTEVEVDSPAMKAGIQSGDIITKVDDEEITSFVNYHSVIIRQEAGKAIQIVGQRQGSESYVDIKFNMTVGIKQ